MWTSWKAEKLHDQQGGVEKDDNMGAWYAKQEQVLCWWGLGLEYRYTCINSHDNGINFGFLNSNYFLFADDFVFFPNQNPAFKSMLRR